MRMSRALMVTMAAVFLCWPLITFAQQSDAPASQEQEKNQPESSAQQDSPQQDAPSRPDSSTQRERQAEVSSSKDTRVDLSPPSGDDKKHPQSGTVVMDAEDPNTDVQEMHAWDPHKAAKDVEVGDFYYKRKNYRAALERYKEALVYKPNDALATYRLAECQDKTGNGSEAITHYQDYLKILPHGPFALDAQKALDRLKAAGPKESAN
jgi:tetratricopeptide (TPR) repeat protein